MKGSVLGAGLALLLAGCTATSSAPQATMPTKARYVSLGSSFAAGAGIGPLQPGTPERCSRTANNYASRLAGLLDLLLVDASCSGATTAHVLGPWNDLPPQIDSVTENTQLVTITIGGNDLGYVGWLFAGSCRLGVTLFPGRCREAAEPQEALYRALEQQLRAIAGEVRRRAPKARLVFVQYVTLSSEKACPLEAISRADAAVARRIGAQLSAVTKRAAQSAGADVLATDKASQGHTPCSPNAWSNGLSAGYDTRQGAPWHPNAAGHAAIADLLRAKLSRRGWAR